MQLQWRKKVWALPINKGTLILYIRDSRALIDNFYAWCNMYISGDSQGTSPGFFPMTCSRLSKLYKKSNWKFEYRLEIHNWCFDEGSVIFFYCSNTQHCFYKISCLKIISSGDCIFKTLQWRAATEHLLHQLILTFFACHCETLFATIKDNPFSHSSSFYSSLLLSSQVEWLAIMAYRRLLFPRCKYMKYIPRLLCLCYIHDQLESSLVWWNWIREESDAEM